MDWIGWGFEDGGTGRRQQQKMISVEKDMGHMVAGRFQVGWTARQISCNGHDWGICSTMTTIIQFNFLPFLCSTMNLFLAINFIGANC